MDGPHPTAWRRASWLRSLRAYTMVLVPAMLAWEVAQLPLYTLWRDGGWGTIVYAVLHCTLGDALIGVAALAWALLLAGEEAWPARGFTRVLGAAVTIGVAYTIYSEWLNVEIRQAWAYAEAMPRLPWLGTGLAPLLQWVAVPPLALLAARRANVPGPEAP
jgi:hypothetical protein